MVNTGYIWQYIVVLMQNIGDLLQGSATTMIGEFGSTISWKLPFIRLSLFAFNVSCHAFTVDPKISYINCLFYNMSIQVN